MAEFTSFHSYEIKSFRFDNFPLFSFFLPWFFCCCSCYVDFSSWLLPSGFLPFTYTHTFWVSRRRELSLLPFYIFFSSFHLPFTIFLRVFPSITVLRKYLGGSFAITIFVFYSFFFFTSCSTMFIGNEAKATEQKNTKVPPIEIECLLCKARMQLFVPRLSDMWNFLLLFFVHIFLFGFSLFPYRILAITKMMIRLRYLFLVSLLFKKNKFSYAFQPKHSCFRLKQCACDWYIYLNYQLIGWNRQWIENELENGTKIKKNANKIFMWRTCAINHCQIIELFSAYNNV